MYCLHDMKLWKTQNTSLPRILLLIRTFLRTTQDYRVKKYHLYHNIMKANELCHLKERNEFAQRRLQNYSRDRFKQTLALRKQPGTCRSKAYPLASLGLAIQLHSLLCFDFSIIRSSLLHFLFCIEHTQACRSSSLTPPPCVFFCDPQ